MNDPDQAVTFSIPKDSGPAETSWPDEGLRDVELGGEEDLAVDRSVTFTSLGFISAALRRSAWLWCATAVFGIVLGYGLYVKYPPGYQATTSVLITNDPSQNPAEEIQTNVALAGSQAVAGQAIRQLGLNESVNTFLAAYTVSDPSDQVLVFTIGAGSSAQAVREVSVLDSVFLQFRASYLNNQLKIEQTTLKQQVTEAGQQVTNLNQEISTVSAEPVTGAQQAKLTSLRTQLTIAENALTTAQQNAAGTLATATATTASEIQGSQSLSSPTALPHTFKKGKAFYIGVTFFIGLVLGLAIVIIRALMSDRLRRRDEIADVIGAPVKLSITSIAGRRTLPRPGSSASAKALDSRRVVTHIQGLVTQLAVAAPRAPRRLKGLAVVAVDNAEEVASTVVQLASWNADQGKSVIVADLADGKHAARLLGVRRPGIHTVSRRGVDVVVVVPERDDIALLGPIPGPQDESPNIDPQLANACASADLLFTLATLDPASGGDFLSTWATDAVAVVTAGKSSSVRIRAVGEMIRLAGLRLASVVLMGADKNDESLGLVYAWDEESASPLAI